jgi:hypothetical protein
VVVDPALPVVLPHPAIRTQMTATATAAVGWRMCSSHCGRAQPISAA